MKNRFVPRRDMPPRQVECSLNERYKIAITAAPHGLTGWHLPSIPRRPTAGNKKSDALGKRIAPDKTPASVPWQGSPEVIGDPVR